MMMFPVLGVLIIVALIGIWALLIKFGTHDKLGNKVEKFVEDNLTDKKENENE